MARWLHADVLDNGPAYLKANCNQVSVLKAYAAGDNYATVTGNSVCDIAASSSDFTLAAGSYSNSRKISIVAKEANATANSGASPDLHFAYLDTANTKILAVTDETSDQQIYAGNLVACPALDPLFVFLQPTPPP